MCFKILAILISTAVFLLCVKESMTYPTGGPVSQCKSMEPGHGYDPQTSTPPFVIQLDKTNVKGGQPIHVTLTPANSQVEFRGFFAQGQPQSSSYNVIEKPYGKFQISNNDLIKYVNCNGTPQSALTHTTNSPKEIIEFDWVAPNEDRQYVILVTFVQDFKTYWVRVPSDKILVSKDAQLVEV